MNPAHDRPREVHPAPGVRLLVTRDAAALARAAADEIHAAIRAKPDAVVLAATGSTPMSTYAELAARHARGELDTSRLRVAQLDEYLGVTDDDPRSLYGWMRRSVLEPLEVPDARVLRFHPGRDARDDAAAFDAGLRAWGGLDLAVLGLGPNGHVGFNEPPTAPDAVTRAVDLAAASLESNASYWNGLDVPRRAITAGLNVILAARRTLLLVSGAHKRDVLRRALLDAPTPQLPASYLRDTPLTVIADADAWPETT